ncbi:MAG: rhodanese-like domain-containing protein [Planctomycetes bacterium]|nr:rhodanese-like domain-containing protein [Planctomycetota bacterium]
MEITALILAVVALILAWSTRSALELLRTEIATLRSGGPAAHGDDMEGISERVHMNSRFLARLAAGESLAPQQVRDGHLWVEVSPEEGLAMVQKGVRILDVRNPQETAGGIIPGAICIPVDELPNRAEELPRDHATTLVYCGIGVRSAAACEYLTSQGFDALYSLDGGFSSWPGDRVRPA